MKIAICLSGFMRTFHQTIHSLNQFLLYPYNCDIYISTWDKIGNFNYKKRIVNELSKGNLTEENIVEEDLRSFYGENLKCCKIEKLNEVVPWSFKVWEGHLDNIVAWDLYKKRPLDADVLTPKELIKRTHSMFYKIQDVDKLRRFYEKLNFSKYDCVIRHRTDMHIKRMINLHNLKLDHNTIYTPSAGLNAISDLFAIGSSEAMQKYSDFYDYIEYYYNPSQTLCTPEFKLKDYFVQKRLISLTSKEIKLDFCRPYR